MATTTITRTASASASTNNITYYGENDPVQKVLEYLNEVSDIEQAEDAAAFIIMKKAEEMGIENPDCNDFEEVIETFSIMLENCRKARKAYKENRFEISDLENRIRNLESEIFEAKYKLQEVTRKRTSVISENKKAATAFLTFESKIESFIKIQKERKEEIEKQETEQKQKKREQLFSILKENPDLLEEVKREFDISDRDVHIEISDGGDYKTDTTNKWLIYATHIRDVLDGNSLPNLDLIKDMMKDSDGHIQAELRKLMHFNSNSQINKFNKLILDPLKLGHLGLRKNATSTRSCTNRRKRVYTKQYKLEVLNEFIEDNK